MQTRLGAAGIAAQVRPESEVEHLAEFSRPCAGMRVEVPRNAFEAALKMVYDWNSSAESKPSVFMPPLFEPVPSRESSRPEISP